MASRGLGRGSLLQSSWTELPSGDRPQTTTAKRNPDHDGGLADAGEEEQGVQVHDGLEGGAQDSNHQAMEGEELEEDEHLLSLVDR